MSIQNPKSNKSTTKSTKRPNHTTKSKRTPISTVLLISTMFLAPRSVLVSPQHRCLFLASGLLSRATDNNLTETACRRSRRCAFSSSDTTKSRIRPSVQRSHRLADSDSNENRAPRKRLDVAIVGAPNAGKSQLINVLTNSPVAAVSRKRHTTRTGILGARTVGHTQIVFNDTPGFLRIENAKEERLDRDLIATAAAEMQNVDYTLLVVDAARTISDTYKEALVELMLNAVNAQGRIEEVYDEAKISRKPDISTRSKFAIVLNKVDLVKPKSKLIDIAMELGAIADTCLPFQYRGQTTPEEANKPLDYDTLMAISPETFYISALEEDGTEELLQHLVDLATPCQVWAVPSGNVTDLTPQERTVEIIREKLYRCLHREVPHHITQVNRLFRKLPEGWVIHQELIVSTKSHQRLVLGNGGRTLKRIEETSMRDLQKAFKCPVSLQLRVKLSKGKQGQTTEDYSHANYD